ncbi:hypothetical protein [Desulfonatronum thiosulfatophilum]|uniref:hypothetical protein n=1 Tax=Desulfonatronum thiosulfatophilum TaxID=617002 RepID=UPI00137B1E0C|nr:hypothetical protein [Desulfonatronum thiosulfatophilum]
MTVSVVPPRRLCAVATFLAALVGFCLGAAGAAFLRVHLLLLRDVGANHPPDLSRTTATLME